MDKLPSTHYIPSFFEFTPSGRQLIISQFHEQYPDIFVGYENGINAFFINTNDTEAISTLLGIFAAQVRLFQTGKGGESPESPKMLPLDHTFLARDLTESVPSVMQLTKHDMNILIDLEEDSEESSNDTSSEDNSICWVPNGGDIGILQRDLANAVADATGCIFCPEPEHRRVRLVSGNTQAALIKLQRLEPLLHILTGQELGPKMRVDHNMISFSCQQKGTGVCYVPALRQPHADRIVVDCDLEDTIESMLIGEEQIYNEASGKYARAANLDVLYTKEESAVPSTIWAHYQSSSFGNPDNAQPQPQSSSIGVSTLPSVDALNENENMGVAEQARVRAWSKKIDVSADPTQAVSSPTILELDDEGPAPSRKTVMSDSDDEGGTVEELTHRVVAQDSDDESLSEGHTTSIKPVRLSSHDAEVPQSPSNGRSAHVTEFGRADRHREQASRSLTNPLIGNTLEYVAADTFFAGMPRDKDGGDRGGPQPTASSDQQSFTVDAPPKNTPSQKSQPRRGFGYDGAADLSDQFDPASPMQARGVADADDIPDPMKTQAHRSISSDQIKPKLKFDPRNYSASKRAAQHQTDRRYPTYADHFPHVQQQRSPTPSWPRPLTQPGSSPGSQQKHLSQSQPDRMQSQLIDYAADGKGASKTSMPPPGLSSDIQLGRLETTTDSHILDVPLDDIQKPAIKPAFDGSTVPTNDEFSVSTSTSSGNRHPIFDYNVQTKINKPDIGYIRNDMVSQLMAARHQKKSNKRLPMIKKTSSERMDPEDEVSTRRYHNTMNLTAPNTGRSKKKKSGQPNAPKSETAAQKAERIAAAKADLGLATGQPAKTQACPLQGKAESMSKKAQQAARLNSQMGHLHVDALRSDSRKKLARELVEHMKEISRVVRLFPGYIHFEFQIGQLLVMPTSRIKAGVAYEIDKWKTMFNNDTSSAEVFFTNLLTTSGSDADGILNTKTGGSQTWNKHVPGPCSVVLDFECQDSSGSEFQLHFNVDGTYSISKDDFVLHRVGVHCPGRTWDTCAVVKARPVWRNLPDMLQKSVTDLVESIYVKQENQVNIFFRCPSDNSLTVREVVVRRTSCHKCQVPGDEDVQLKIVESKTLYMTGHKKDKRLTRCSEKDHEVMAQDDRVRYEVSLTHEAIRADLMQNETLGPGEETLIDASRPALFSYDRTLCILESALRLVDKIDWVGGYNVGTIVQRQYMRVRKEEEAARSMPPPALDYNFIRPAHLPSGMTVAGPRSVVGTRTMIGSNVGGDTHLSVHGIRSGTKAQIVTDGRGNYFRIGLGGARIPLGIPEGSSQDTDGIAPDDSASQIGGLRRPLRRAEERPDSFW